MSVKKDGKYWSIRVQRNGKRRCLKRKCGRHEAKKLEADLIRKLDEEATAIQANGGLPVPDISEFCRDRYVPYAKSHLAFSTYHRVRRYQVRRLMKFFEGTRLDLFTGASVDAYKMERLSDGLENSSINDELKVLSAIFTYASDLGIYPNLKAPKIKKMKVAGKERMEVWSVEEVQKLLKTCSTVQPDILPMVAFLANTGCRRSEALAMRTRCINLHRKTVTITPYDNYQTKTGKVREVGISDDLLPYLLPERLGKEFAFESVNGTRFKFFPQRKWDRVVKAAGLNGGPHKLRHTYASHLVQETRNLFLAAQILGHSHATMTEKYAHLLPHGLELARKAVSFGIAPEIVSNKA